MRQVAFYAELAVRAAGYDTARLSELIDHFDSLPSSAFDQLIEVLTSRPIFGLSEDQRVLLWEHLTKFTNEHRRFSDAKWALPDNLVTRIENIAAQLAPTNPFNLYRHLFTDDDFDLYEENGDWEDQEKRLEAQREAAIIEIFRQNGVDGIIRFAESVNSPVKVGQAVGVIDDEVLEHTFLPHFLDMTDNRRKALVSGFILRRYHIKGWEWCDNVDKSGWTPGQIGYFLVCLPFIKETWERASRWLRESEVEYWSRTRANPYQAGPDLTIAIEKLIEHGRPHAAIECLDCMRRAKLPIDVKQCIRVLLAALSSSEPTYTMDMHHIVELIKFLQVEPSVDQDDLFKVEWAYLPLLNHESGVAPKILESKLASDPEFFCEIIQLIYRSKREDQQPKEPTEKSKAIAKNAWWLLHEWQTPPGTQEDGTFNEERFSGWLQRVKELSIESGHLEVAMIHIGEVLIYAPSDPDGLWIHRSIATALNDCDANDMREGFKTATFNSRGAHFVDPTGKPEKEIAEHFRHKAEDVENAGFHRFATALRDLAQSYEYEAERIIHEQNNLDEE